MTDIKHLVLDEEKFGNVVLHTIEGIGTCSLDELIKQPAEGILYDLNRDKVTVLTFIDDPKWVNDYAVALVITKLKSRIDLLESALREIIILSEPLGYLTADIKKIAKRVLGKG